MAESKMIEFKMADIIKLSENEWVKFFGSKWWDPRWHIGKMAAIMKLIRLKY